MPICPGWASNHHVKYLFNSLLLTLTYSIKEMFYTLQGEGAQAGRPAVFCRFAGCNLWSGLEADRASAICRFCDTDFVGTDGQGGGKFRDAEALAEAINRLWPSTYLPSKFVVFTGGEPLLQLDCTLTQCLHTHGFTVAIETNGTLPVPAGVDWVCVSPKAGATLAVQSGDELKVVVPQTGQTLSDYEKLAFQHFFVQPMDNLSQQANTRLAIEFCKSNPQWKLSLQTHKFLGIP